MAAARGERVRFFYLAEGRRPDVESRRESETVRDNYQAFTEFSGIQLPDKGEAPFQEESLPFDSSFASPPTSPTWNFHKSEGGVEQLEKSVVPSSKYRK